ncbi:DEAD/DEAH box helicase [Mesorhizobium sp. M1A.F.Ca.ET.072.01.1.1]|uniref:DEAD/DEAH box helicase n=1 Tax=Mesorhizobium sp. M1A.F.Ca.ET.072.01.1.1 TaxID=2496753 RepID=UPI000FD3B508|nr:DEAD/DEAH box helicase [Mesorhizobium sp. M1A.F.Ca.ET.072.01.1.1]RUW55634.1 DEAD/DEAH box helicase [Mesorhizobium sp. M1A.F.Ca.ET.072.01.1.1]
MTIQLRPDQWQLKTDVYGAWNSGANTVLAVLPTGGGKSVVMSDIINDQNQLGAQQCVVAHRTELVSQMSLHVARRGIKHRIIAPKNVVAQIAALHREELGYNFVNPTANCSVAGIDTLNARAEELKGWAAQIDYWHGDEGHHFLLANKWGKGIGLFPRARGSLWTASPSRADGKGLGRHADGLADAMVLGPDQRTLINLGALCDYEIALPESDFYIDEDDVSASGDFTPKKMREASERSHIVGDVVTEYVRHAFGKRAICFATDVETAGKIAKRFNEFGIMAAAVSAETPAAVREDFIKRFKRGAITVLVNVDLFGEGFDVPACEVVIMARPTASLAVYLQQFGRALRTMAGKTHGLIIDHVSNWKRHGNPDKPHFWTLDRREKRAKRAPDPEAIPLITCRGCGRPYERCLPCCPRCGWMPPLPEGGGRSVEEIDGDLILLDRAKLAEMRAAIELPSPADVGSRTAFVAGGLAGAGAVNRQIERIQSQKRLDDAICQWAGIGRAKGRSDQELYRRFYLTVGVDVLSALAMPRADMDALAEKVESWINASLQ